MFLRWGSKSYHVTVTDSVTGQVVVVCKEGSDSTRPTHLDTGGKKPRTSYSVALSDQTLYIVNTKQKMSM